jgi:PHD/YefM family antitoxin component YafN of YafNO toxin-antitoxin module
MGPAVQHVTDEKGEPAVLMPLSDYEQLLEDLQDLAAVANSRNEPTISHEEFMEELKRDGLLPR